MPRRLKTSIIVIYVVSAIIAVLIVVRLAQYFLASSKSKTLIENLEIRPLDIVFGNENASLPIYMYSSYSCIYCNLFFTEVYPALIAEFIDNGKVNIVMRLMVKTNNINLKNSLKTAVCINKHGNYEHLHKLFLNDSKVAFTPDFQSMIDEFIDLDSFVAECILGGEADDYLMKNINDFDSFGFKGTPTFIIENKVYTGYRNYEQFRQIILDHLK